MYIIINHAELDCPWNIQSSVAPVARHVHHEMI